MGRQKNNNKGKRKKFQILVIIGGKSGVLGQIIVMRLIRCLFYDNLVIGTMKIITTFTAFVILKKRDFRLDEH